MKENKKFEMGEHSFLWITFAISVVFFIAAILLYKEHPGVGGDAAFPVVAAFIMLAGAVLSIFEAHHWEPAHPEHLTFKEKIIQAYRMLFPDKTLLMCLYILLYALILNRLGFNISTCLYLFVSMVTLQPKKPLRSLIASILLTAMIYLCFGVLFRVRLP